jgi:hypothetical protein
MKNKKNKKGEIATFLTLGMILVGAVLTVATSFFANKTKNLASNPRAACDTSLIPSPSMAICFCQKGKVRVYASSTARKNNCMASTPEQYGNAYGAHSWGWCNDDTSHYTGDCPSSTTPEGGDSPKAAPKPSNNCEEPSFTCQDKFPSDDIRSKNNDVIFSMDNQENYYKGENCPSDGKWGDYQKFADECEILAKKNCYPTKCKNIKEHSSSLSDSVIYYTKDENSYYYYDNENCSGSPKKPEDLCVDTEDKIEKAEKAVCNSNITCNNLPGMDGRTVYGDGTASYKVVDGKNIYYKGSNCDGTKTENLEEIIDYCNSKKPPSPTPTKTIPFELYENGHGNVNLSGLWCSDTGILYDGSEGSINNALNMCLNTFKYRRDCLKIVASDKGVWRVWAYYYCCSDDYNCKSEENSGGNQ